MLEKYLIVYSVVEVVSRNGGITQVLSKTMRKLFKIFKMSIVTFCEKLMLNVRKL